MIFKLLANTYAYEHYCLPLPGKPCSVLEEQHLHTRLELLQFKNQGCTVVVSAVHATVTSFV